MAHGGGGQQKFLAAVGQAPWVKLLILGDTGKPKNILYNAVLALEHAPEVRDAIYWDMFRTETVLMAPVPWDLQPVTPRGWKDHDDREATAWLQDQGLIVSEQIVSEAVETVAQRSQFHPVTEYLTRLHWDGINRIDTWLMDYCGAIDTDLIRAFAARWLVSAIARIQEPGCKADCVLLFEGPQGIFKSTVFQILGGPFYSNDIGGIGTKEAQEQILGKWLVEFDELDAIVRAREIGAVKAFVSRSVDDFRLPYARRSQKHPRQCVFCATTNLEVWHRDPTGGRRWWPVKVAVTHPIDIEGLYRDRDQLWAEAIERWNGGERWWLHEPELEAAQQAEMALRYEEDPWDGSALTAARSLVSPTRRQVSMEEIMREMGIPLDRRDKLASSRIFTVLRLHKWARTKDPDDGRFYYSPPR